MGTSRYIHLNSIEAGLVTHLADYPWSSYRELFGTAEYSIIDHPEVNRLIGDTEKERKIYHQFLLEGINLIDDLKSEYTFDKEIEGEPKFYTISQKKYLRRKSKQRKIKQKKT